MGLIEGGAEVTGRQREEGDTGLDSETLYWEETQVCEVGGVLRVVLHTDQKVFMGRPWRRSG